MTKKKCRNFLLVIALFFAQSLYGYVINIQSLEELMAHDFNESLVIFDIDETLVTYQEMIGHAYLLADAQDSPFMDANHLTCSQRKRLQNSLSLELVEEIAPAVIRKLQKRGDHITWFCPANSSQECMEDKLNNLGFSFANFLKLGGGEIHRLSTEDIESQIKQLKESTDFQMREIILVSSNESLLGQVQKACLSQDIPMKGFKYKSGKKSCYNPAVARLQLSYFDQILSNQDAEKILRARQ